jgi:hypothetical protein
MQFVPSVLFRYGRLRGTYEYLTPVFVGGT